jgi:hypothetical protein
MIVPNGATRAKANATFTFTDGAAKYDAMTFDLDSGRGGCSGTVPPEPEPEPTPTPTPTTGG